MVSGLRGGVGGRESRMAMDFESKEEGTEDAARGDVTMERLGRFSSLDG